MIEVRVKIEGEGRCAVAQAEEVPGVPVDALRKACGVVAKVFSKSHLAGTDPLKDRVTITFNVFKNGEDFAIPIVAFQELLA